MFTNQPEATTQSTGCLQGEGFEPAVHARTISYKVIKREDDFNALQKDWDRLCEISNGHIFQTFEWNRIWWKHFGFYGELHLFVLYDHETIVGIAPLFYDRFQLPGLSPFVCLRIIGSRIFQTPQGVLLGEKAYSDYLQFLIQPEYTPSFFDHFMHFLKHESRFDQLILEEIPEQSCTLHMLNQDFSALGYSLNKHNASSCPSIPPADTWEDYLSRLNVRERNNARRSLKNIYDKKKKLFRFERLQPGQAAEPFVNRCIELHQNQWNARGMPGSFAEDSMQGFFKELTSRLHQKGQLKINILTPLTGEQQNQAVCIDVILVYNRRMYGQHRSIDISSPLLKKGPGKALLMATIQEAVESNMTFDFLRGRESYKLRLANRHQQNTTLVASSSTFRNRVYSRILPLVQQFRKNTAREQTRMDIIIKQNGKSRKVLHYLHSLYERVNARFAEMMK